MRYAKKAVDQTGAENRADLFRVPVLRGRGFDRRNITQRGDFPTRSSAWNSCLQLCQLEPEPALVRKNLAEFLLPISEDSLDVGTDE